MENHPRTITTLENAQLKGGAENKERIGLEHLHVVLGFIVAGPFGAAYIAYNTWFND